MRTVLTLTCFFAFTSTLAAEKKAPEKAGLNVGDKVPAFTVKDDTGKEWDSADFADKTVVYYFYPADMTGGCTKQACGFRDDLAKLKAKGITVVGISGDSVRNHQLFKKVHKLNFPLLADTEGKVAKIFGVPLRKGGSIKRKIDGKEETLTRGVTAARWTFVAKNGVVKSKNTRVKAAADSKAVLQAFGKLK